MAEISLEEFINLPDVVELHVQYDQALRSFVKGREYVRVGKVASGNKAVLYVRENRIEGVLRQFGTKNAENLSLVMGLLGTDSIKEANILNVQQELNLKGTGVLCRIYRYRNRLH